MSDLIVSTNLLTKQGSTGDGQLLDHRGTPFKVGSFQCEFFNSPTRVVVTIKGLIDGSTFGTLAVFDTNAGYASGDIASLSFPTLVRQLKANLTTLTGGNLPTVSCYFLGAN